MVVPLGVLVLGLTAHLRAPATVDALRARVFDTYQRITPREYTDLPVRIVDVDDESLRRIGQWPWPRNLLARLIRRLREGGASVVALDFLFSEADRTSPENVLPTWEPSATLDAVRAAIEALPRNDELFADSIAGEDVVTGFVLTNEPREEQPPRPYRMTIRGAPPTARLPTFPGTLVNLPIIDAHAAGIGSFNLVPDGDGVIRRLHLLYRSGEHLYPSLAAEIVRVAQRSDEYIIDTGIPAAEVRAGEPVPINDVRIGALVVPTDGEGRVWLHYTRPAPQRSLPAWRVLSDDFDASSLAGDIVLVGTSAVGLKDLRVTPLNPVAAGVEIQASLVEQALLGHFLRRPAWADAAELLYLLVLTLTLTLLLPRLRALGGALAGSLAVVAAGGASWYMFTVHRWLLDPVLPSLAVLVVYSIGSAINYVRADTDRREIRRAFRHYLAPAVIDSLMSEPGRLSLGGAKRVATFLFSDIADFTTLVEQLEPTRLVRLLNEYLDGTCQIVLRHGGTIDKIVGDAVHVIFNAPTDQPDHADRAVACALEMDEFCEAYARRVRQRGITLGHTRIGINTGVAVVGNFGGAARFDYTAHGDAINTAARLEGANKLLGTHICVSESTRAATTHPSYRPIGRLLLVGKTSSVAVYEPLPVRRANDPALSAYCEAYEHMERGEADAATLFARLSAEHPDDPLAAFHARRLAAGQSGIDIIMTQK